MPSTASTSKRRGPSRSGPIANKPTISSDVSQVISLVQHGEAESAESMLARLASAALAAQAEAREAQAALVIAERRFNATFAQSPVGIAHVAPDGRFLMVNDQFLKITGHGRASLMRLGFQKITHPDDLAADLDHVRRLILGQTDRYVMEKRYLRADGSPVWVNLTVALVRDDEGEPDFFVSVIEDLSEIRKAHADAQRDPLTGLFNRRGFAERATREITRGAKAGDTLCVAYLDLDGFKGINDAHGHCAGDACLIDIARSIESAVRPGDVVARLGGDEFAILMPQLSSLHARRAIDRVRLALTDLGTRHRWPVSGSFGIAVRRPDSAADIDALIAAADSAMFRAKRSGKNCIRVAGAHPGRD
jgi:diguanylate cyclase (GGDEF)-like protein/PAS domain S-box-containing protein